MIGSLSCIGAFRLARRHGLAPLLLLIGTALATSNVAATTYRIVLLPLPPDAHGSVLPAAINNASEVVGDGYRDGSTHAVAWGTGSDHAPRWLPEGDARSSDAFGINDNGYIVGELDDPSGTSYSAAMWPPNGAPIVLRDATNPNIESGAFAINNNRTILGNIVTGTGVAYPFWLRPGTKPRNIPAGQFFTVWPEALNNHDTMVGHGILAVDDGQYHYRAFRSTPRTGRQLLDELPFAGSDVDYHAWDVNDTGEVVGEAYDPTLKRSHVVKWNADGSALDLGGLPGDSEYSYSACCINNAGVVAGKVTYTLAYGDFQGFVWTPANGMHSIVDLIDPLDPLYPEIASGTPIEVIGINDAGVMVGMLDPYDRQRPILLIPNPKKRARLPPPSPEPAPRVPDAARR